MAEHYPVVAVEVLSRVLIGLLNRCMCCLVAEHFSDFLNSVPVKINPLDNRTAKTLAPENEVLIFNDFVCPVFHQHGQLIRGGHETDGVLSTAIGFVVLC